MRYKTNPGINHKITIQKIMLLLADINYYLISLS